MSLVVESTLGGGKLEGPEEVVGDFEVGTASRNFVDQFLNSLDTESAQTLGDDFVGSKRDSLLFDLSVTSLVDQIRDELLSGESESDIRLDFLEHIQSSSIYSDKGGVVDLSESEQLKDLSDLRSQMVDTSDSGHEDNSGFSGNKVRSRSSSSSLLGDDVLLFSNIVLVMGFTSLGNISDLSLGLFSSLLGPFGSGFAELGVSCSLLKKGLGDSGLGFGLFDLH